MKKRIMSLLLAVVMCLAPMSVCFASFLPTNVTPTNPGFEGMTGTVNKVLGAIQWIGYAVAVIMVMYVGIKYLMAGADVKAEAKKNLIPMLVGAVLIVAATTIVSAIFKIGQVQ